MGRAESRQVVEGYLTDVLAGGSDLGVMNLISSQRRAGCRPDDPASDRWFPQRLSRPARDGSADPRPGRHTTGCSRAAHRVVVHGRRPAWGSTRSKTAALRRRWSTGTCSPSWNRSDASSARRQRARDGQEHEMNRKKLTIAAAALLYEVAGGPP
jgi:hypothetical protein